MIAPLLLPTLTNSAASAPGERAICFIRGVKVYYVPGAYVRWCSGMDEDDDGVGAGHGDPYHQGETSYKPGGHSLNADNDIYIVISQAIMNAIPEKTMGRPCEVYNVLTRLWARGVVGDAGPWHKIGEASLACSRALGINSDPIKGGEGRHVVSYVVWLTDPPLWAFPQASQGHNG